MLMALTLTAMLGIGLASVVAGVGRTLAATARTSEDIALRDCRRVMDLDLANAQQVRMDDKSVYLRGVGALDPDRSVVTHRPVEVVYSTMHIGEHSALVRRQFDALHPDTKPERIDIVAFDMGELTLARTQPTPTTPATPVTEPAPKPAPAAGAAWVPIPTGTRWMTSAKAEGAHP
jgi:hypothetical protein